MALTFNGASSKLVGANLVTDYPVSMFCWVRPSAASLTADSMVMGFGDFGGQTEMAMMSAGSAVGDPMRAFVRNTSGASSSAVSAVSMQAEEWQPALVIIRNGTSRSVYFGDSAEMVTENTSRTVAFANFDRFAIGVRPISDTLWANMDIAHAAVWAGELKDDDWQSLRYGAIPSEIRPESLIDYWSLETSGATQTGAKGTVLTATDTATAGTAPTLGQTIPDTEPVRDNGIWTWFTEPRARHYNGSTYIGWVDNQGSVGITKFDHATKERRYFVLAAALEVDDHDNAAIHIRPDGRIVAFYSKHNDAGGLRYRISSNPEDISAWGAEQTVATGGSYAYSNPRYLSGNGRLYIHYRLSVQSQYLAYSDDHGETWSTPTQFIVNGAQRPYVKSITNGTDRIDFYLTDGHPGEISTSLYHCYAQLVGGVLKYFTSDGATELTLPISVSSCTEIYDGSTVPGWQWDAKYGADGHPRIIFSRSISQTDLRYHFARWTGSAWSVVEIATAGASLYASEPSYAAGACFSAGDVDTIYLARESGGISEIEEWTTADDGATWSKARDVTTGSGSGVKNARPFAPWDAAPEMELLWWRGNYTTYANYNTNIYFEAGVAGTSEHTLIVSPSTQAQQSAAVSVASSHTLVVANSTQAQTSAAVAVSAGSTHTLTVAASKQAHTSAAVTIDQTQQTSQYGRPVSDIAAGDWAPSTGATLAGVLDETTASDTDYITASGTTPCTLALNPVATPSAGTTKTVKVRAWSPTSGSVTVELLQNTTVIASWTQVLTTSATTYAFNLTSTQAGNITDYSALRVRLTAA